MTKNTRENHLIKPATEKPALDENPYKLGSIKYKLWERARYITLWRFSHGWTQYMLAVHCKVSPATISRIEASGWICQRVIQKLLELGMDEDVLAIHEL